jgi:hypothetical protein
MSREGLSFDALEIFLNYMTATLSLIIGFSSSQGTRFDTI